MKKITLWSIKELNKETRENSWVTKHVEDGWSLDQKPKPKPTPPEDDRIWMKQYAFSKEGKMIKIDPDPLLYRLIRVYYQANQEMIPNQPFDVLKKSEHTLLVDGRTVHVWYDEKPLYYLEEQGHIFMLGTIDHEDLKDTLENDWKTYPLVMELMMHWRENPQYINRFYEKEKERFRLDFMQQLIFVLGYMWINDPNGEKIQLKDYWRKSNMNIKEKALEFAKKAHEGQTRKTPIMINGEKVYRPYITHPIEVAKILKEAGFSHEVVAAGCLHDTVEDTNTTIEEIALQFGDEVARIVAGNTEEKERNGVPVSWEERKQHTLDELLKQPIEIHALVVADKLSNLRQLVEDHKLQGEAVWSHFKRGKEQQKWYFSGVAKNAMEGLTPEQIPDFFYTYQQLVQDFFE